MRNVEDLGWTVEAKGVIPNPWVIIRRVDRSLYDGSVVGADWGLFPNADRGFVNPSLTVSVRFREDRVTVAWSGVSGASEFDLGHMLNMLAQANNYIALRAELDDAAWREAHETS